MEVGEYCSNSTFFICAPGSARGAELGIIRTVCFSRSGTSEKGGSAVSKESEQPPLRIRPGHSRLLAVFLLVTHALALAVVFAVPLSGYWRVGLAAVVLLSLSHAIGAQVLFLVPWAGREAVWRSDGTWTLTLVSGEQTDARLLPSTYVTQRLLVLNFRRGRWRSSAMVIVPDALDPDLLRRLRVRLRLWGAAGKSSTSDFA